MKSGIKSTAELPDYYYGLPNINTTENDALKRFIMKLNDEKPYPPIVQIIRLDQLIYLFNSFNII